MDRNLWWGVRKAVGSLVALRKESVDRNILTITICTASKKSLSARRAWIEIVITAMTSQISVVALRKESVDRNTNFLPASLFNLPSLSARRAWIEIIKKGRARRPGQSRSPQGERG